MAFFDSASVQCVALLALAACPTTLPTDAPAGRRMSAGWLADGPARTLGERRRELVQRLPRMGLDYLTHERQVVFTESRLAPTTPRRACLPSSVV